MCPGPTCLAQVMSMASCPPDHKDCMLAPKLAIPPCTPGHEDAKDVVSLQLALMESPLISLLLALTISNLQK
ncbi:A disintegrin and metalloproteinase with thrombospondin motifs 20, partial [Clarias magur]